MAGNGVYLSITHTSIRYISKPHRLLPLKNVLEVSTIKKSFLSVFQITKDYPCYFVFDDVGFRIKDCKTHKILATKKSNGDYTNKDTTQVVFFFLRNKSATMDV